MFAAETSLQYQQIPNSPLSRLMLNGRASLSDTELLSILSDTTTEQAARVLNLTDGNLHDIGKIPIQTFVRAGLSERKAGKIIAALEIGRRRHCSDLRERPRISKSQDAYNVIAPLLTDLQHEEFWILMLNKANEVFSRERLSVGGMAGTVVDVKMLFGLCLERKASGFIAIHNHPSGSLQPSQADVELTRRLKKSGELLDMPCLDHLIISERGYYSFCDEGEI